MLNYREGGLLHLISAKSWIVEIKLFSYYLKFFYYDIVNFITEIATLCLNFAPIAKTKLCSN